MARLKLYLGTSVYWHEGMARLSPVEQDPRSKTFLHALLVEFRKHILIQTVCCTTRLINSFWHRNELDARLMIRVV